jgi:glutathione S-transferase
MDLYFAPLSCSMATRIALYESGQDARFHEVVLSTGRTKAGEDYFRIHPMGQVPALVTDEGEVLTEGPAILQFVADRAPESRLAPPAGTFARSQLQQWLNYIGTEVHKAVFATIFNPAAPPEARAYARQIAGKRFDVLSRHLANRDFLVGDTFTVADAYLAVALGWAEPAGVDLSGFPVLLAWRERMRSRPAVARALEEELALRAGAAS